MLLTEWFSSAGGAAGMASSCCQRMRARIRFILASAFAGCREERNSRDSGRKNQVKKTAANDRALPKKNTAGQPEDSINQTAANPPAVAPSG